MEPNLLAPDMSLSLIYPKGLIMWRPCSFSKQGTQIETVNFSKTDKGSYLARCRLNGNFMFEPEINEKHGTYVFLDTPPPDNWTHLVISHISKKLKESPLDNPKGVGCAIFAKVGKPYTNYADFRSRMYEQVVGRLNSPYEDRLQTILEIWPEDWRPGDTRMCYMNNAYNAEGYEQMLPAYNIVTAAAEEEECTSETSAKQLQESKSS